MPYCDTACSISSTVYCRLQSSSSTWPQRGSQPLALLSCRLSGIRYGCSGVKASSPIAISASFLPIALYRSKLPGTPPPAWNR